MNRIRTAWVSYCSHLAFLSPTARLTAGVPFQVISDGSHVVVLRRAIDAAHTDAVSRPGFAGPQHRRTCWLRRPMRLSRSRQTAAVRTGHG
ncbi:hypothetical protein [Streptomyces uncialis]|uniref:hypothetical protein n=1 Tax=Streptomyces uncialis TaxID=1048205 RepID=UPI00340636E4